MDSSHSSSSYNPMHTNSFPENDLSFEEDLYYPMMFNFPNSPHIHLEYEDVYLQYLDLFYQHQSSVIDHHTILAVDHDQDDATGSGHHMSIGRTVDVINQTSTVTKKRCSKKDRHSKINTARGPRDRRMRLSLDVARKFFELQDMLGYDKASRTVEWLLNNSKPAISELGRSRASVCSASSTSVDDCCDVVSSSINQSTTVGSNQEPPPSSSCTIIKRIGKMIKVSRASVSRESRINARERARERTSQKRRSMSSNNDELRQFTDCEGGDHDSLVYTSPWCSTTRVFPHKNAHPCGKSSIVIMEKSSSSLPDLPPASRWRVWICS